MKDFYALNPKLVMRYQPYMMAWKKNQQDVMSDEGWTNGLYVGRAISASFPKGKNYPPEPLKLYSSNDPEDTEARKPITDADRFGGFVAMFNKQFQDAHTDMKEIPPDNTPDNTDITW